MQGYVTALIMEKEDEPHLPLPHDGNYEFILPRVSCDSKTVNQYGKWLVDFYTDNQMYIVNERTLGDFTGKFTCHTQRGSSVVDYFISSRSLSNAIFNMYVDDVSLFSHHFALTMKLKIRDNFVMRLIQIVFLCLTNFYGLRKQTQISRSIPYSRGKK